MNHPFFNNPDFVNGANQLRDARPGDVFAVIFDHPAYASIVLGILTGRRGTVIESFDGKVILVDIDGVKLHILRQQVNII